MTTKKTAKAKSKEKPEAKEAEVVEEATQHTPKVFIDLAEKQSLITLEKEIENTIPQVFVEAQRNLIMNETPRYKIKKRQGPGGMVFDYVDVSYVIEQLNILAGFRWHFKHITKVDAEFISKSIEIGQFLVEGRLTIIGKDNQEVYKEDSGRGIIKKNRNGELLDVGNDLKGAWSDCLKRCARMFAIALDVYSGAVKRRQDSEHPEAVITDSQRGRLQSLAESAKIGDAGLNKVIKELFDYPDIKEIQRKNFEAIVATLSSMEAEAHQDEIPEDYQMGFDILGTSKAKRLAMYRSYKNKGMLEELKKKMNDKIDELQAKADKKNGSTS